MKKKLLARLIQSVLVIGFLSVSSEAKSLPITLNFTNANLTLNVVSDWNDWQWDFVLNWIPDEATPPSISSLHISGLEGDVTDNWEYEDFQETDNWGDPTRTKATGALDWTSGTSGINLGSLTSSGVNRQVTISFDSDYNYDPQKIYRIGLDYSNGDWEYQYIQNSKPIPEPATMLLMGTGLAGLIVARRRKKS